MRWLRDYPPFNDPAKRDELYAKLSGIPGLRMSTIGMEGFPKVPLGSLTSKDVLDGFLATMTWMVEQIQKAGRV